MGCVDAGSRRRERAAAAAGSARSKAVESTPYSTLPPSVTSVTREGDPPSTSAEAGSSQGQNGVWSSRTATRSASSPASERPAVLEAECARAVERRELQGRGGRERLRVARARAREQQGSAHLVEHVQRERRGRAVGAQAHADAGRAEPRERRHAAAEQRVGARAVRHGRPTRRQRGDLLVAHVHRMRHDGLGAEQPALGQLQDRMTAEGRDEARQEAGPADQRIQLVPRLAEVRDDAQAARTGARDDLAEQRQARR